MNWVWILALAASGLSAVIIVFVLVFPVYNRLNPPEVGRIFILSGSSDETQIRNFVPKEARTIINIDNKVIWTNEDTVAHTVISDENYSNAFTGTFRSGMIDPGRDYTYVFIEQGIYKYHCDIHPWMNAQIQILRRD